MPNCLHCKSLDLKVLFLYYYSRFGATVLRDIYLNTGFLMMAFPVQRLLLSLWMGCLLLIQTVPVFFAFSSDQLKNENKLYAQTSDSNLFLFVIAVDISLTLYEKNHNKTKTSIHTKLTQTTFTFIHSTSFANLLNNQQKGQFFKWVNTKICQNLVYTIKYTFDVKKGLKQV